MAVHQAASTSEALFQLVDLLPLGPLDTAFNSTEVESRMYEVENKVEPEQAVSTRV